jgi:hypothetical protein
MEDRVGIKVNAVLLLIDLLLKNATKKKRRREKKIRLLTALQRSLGMSHAHEI